jgi:hypothetical protein
MGDVVSPRAVTENVTCHQWFTKGLNSILTFPTICVHMCRVSSVSFHASYGNKGQRSIASPALVSCFASIFLSSCKISILFHRFFSFLIPLCGASSCSLRSSKCLAIAMLYLFPGNSIQRGARDVIPQKQGNRIYIQEARQEAASM